MRTQKLTQGKLDEIEQLANAKIAEDAPCFFFRIPRADADARYGDMIYDRLKVRFRHGPRGPRRVP